MRHAFTALKAVLNFWAALAVLCFVLGILFLFWSELDHAIRNYIAQFAYPPDGN